MAIWDVKKAEDDLTAAFKADSEIQLLAALKDNTFLFSELVSRQFSVRPIFREVTFGDFRCDFAWLNDNSDGPEWVLVEVEKPHMRLFNADGKPGVELNAALEQIKSWDRYFDTLRGENARIFGAVSKLRLILVAGSIADWREHGPMLWRAKESVRVNIEIRSTDVFWKALDMYKKHSRGFFSFEENPTTYPGANLKKFWMEDPYMQQMRLRFNLD